MIIGHIFFVVEVVIGMQMRLIRREFDDRSTWIVVKHSFLCHSDRHDCVGTRHTTHRQSTIDQLIFVDFLCFASRCCCWWWSEQSEGEPIAVSRCSLPTDFTRITRGYFTEDSFQIFGRLNFFRGRQTSWMAEQWPISSLLSLSIESTTRPAVIPYHHWRMLLFFLSTAGL